MSGDWFHSGDMAVWGPEHYIHIVDRKWWREHLVHRGGEGDLRPSRGNGVRGVCGSRPEMGRGAGSGYRRQGRDAVGPGRTAGVSGRAPGGIQNAAVGRVHDRAPSQNRHGQDPETRIAGSLLAGSPGEGGPILTRGGPGYRLEEALSVFRTPLMAISR